MFGHQTSIQQLLTAQGPEVEVVFFCLELPEVPWKIVSPLAKFGTTRSQRRADSRQNLLRPAVIMMYHQMDCFGSNVVHVAAPANMQQRRHALLSIEKQDSLAVSYFHQQNHIRQRANEAVITMVGRRQLGIDLRAHIDDHYVAAVDLARKKESGAPGNHGDSSQILPDIGRLVTSVVANVQRIKWGRANATQPGKNGVACGFTLGELTKPIKGDPVAAAALQSSNTGETAMDGCSHRVKSLAPGPLWP